MGEGNKSRVREGKKGAERNVKRGMMDEGVRRGKEE